MLSGPLIIRLANFKTLELTLHLLHLPSARASAPYSLVHLTGAGDQLERLANHRDQSITQPRAT